jgi:hypothetical protein
MWSTQTFYTMTSSQGGMVPSYFTVSIGRYFSEITTCNVWHQLLWLLWLCGSLERTLEDQHEHPLPTMEGVHSFPSRYGLHLEALFGTGFFTLKNIVVFVNCLFQLWSFMTPFVFTLICQLQLKRATVLQSGVSTHSVCQFSACGIWGRKCIQVFHVFLLILPILPHFARFSWVHRVKDKLFQM